MTDGSPDPGPHFEALARTATDAFVTITPDSVIRYANPAVEDILGYPPDDLLGEPLTVLMPSELEEQHRLGMERYLETGERALDWEGLRLPGEHAAGHRVPLDVSFSEFFQDDTRYFTGIIRDASERERHEQRLTQLNRYAQDLAAAETRAAVCERTVETARETLGEPIAAVELYDEERGRLEPRAWTPRVEELAPDGRLFAGDRSLPWQVFTSQEERVVADVREVAAVEPGETPLRSAVVLPIGEHGAFVLGATEPDAFGEADVNLARILVANADSALQRVSRTESLVEQKRELEERTAALERLRRINEVIRDVTTALTGAADREEVTRDVCDLLAGAEPYRFAWFGTHDPATDEVVPEAWAGHEDGYLEEITVTADESDETGQGPVGRAVRTGRPQVQNDLFGDPPFEPWRQAALEREYRAAVSVPVAHRDALYGVLNIYASEVDAFDGLEVAVLEELGETVGYALNALERKQALFSERSVELAFEVDATGAPVLGLAAAVGGTVAIESLVEEVGGSVRAFFTVTGADPAAVVSAAEQDPDVEQVRQLTGDDGEYRFEGRLGGGTVWGRVLQRGGAVREATADGADGRVVVRIPLSADPRTFDALLNNTLDRADLVGRREQADPVVTPQEFRAQFRDRLTDRQDEVLQTAYFAGFFEWPRRVNAGELADILDVSQPTVSRHLRTGERTLLAMLYDDGEGL